MNTEEFIHRAAAVHGDSYDYSKVRYKNSKTRVEIICPVHGSFMQYPYNHLSGHRCPVCSKLGTRITKEEFVEKAVRVHLSKYDYSRVNYVTTDVPVEIVCPVHGSFRQTPHCHLHGRGCPKCGHSRKH